MACSNRKYVLRNHFVEQTIRQAKEKGFSEVGKLLRIPYASFCEHSGDAARAGFPPDGAAGIDINCSS